MERIRIAVVSPDAAYNRVFGMSLADACRQLEIRTYMAKDFILQWADHEGTGALNNKFDLVLWAGDEIREAYGGNIVYLTDTISLSNMDYEGSRFALYRYSRTDTIVAAVFDIYAHLTGRQVLRIKRNDIRLLAFASSSGGVGCTTVTRAVSQELTRFHGRRVLYLSMEDVVSAAEFLPLPEGIRTEGEFLYRLLGCGNMPFLEPYLIRDPFGVYSFAPSAGKNPLRELNGGEMQQLLASLMESGAFDVLTVDLSTSLGEAALTVFGVAEQICLIENTAEPAMREAHYMKCLTDCCGAEIEDRILRIARPAGAVNEQMPSPMSPLEGKYGREISKLTEALLDVVQ